jgi:demethylmenaquinone methyltransferase/2-methoxy-6-polyprenyl-1,4-benzoquinol methylase/ArsR family transcriptional regulator
VAEADVERALMDAVGQGPFQAVLDLGTGTGRIMELLAARAVRAVGVDASAAMLSVARTRLERAGLKNLQLRHGDIYALPVERNAYDVAVIHQVLHYLDDPARAVREAARTLRPGGKLVVADFAPHGQEFLRDQHAHRRLGFEPAEVDQMLADAGLECAGHRRLSGSGATLTVIIWQGRDPRILSDQLMQDLPRLREIA